MGNGGPVQLPKPGDKGSGAVNGNGKSDLAKAFADLQTGKEEPLTIGGATFNDPRYASLFSDNGKKPAPPPQLMEQQVSEQNGAGRNSEGSYILGAGQVQKPTSAQPQAAALKPAPPVQQQAPAPSSQSQANGAQEQNGNLHQHEIDELRTQLGFAKDNGKALMSLTNALVDEIKNGGGNAKLHHLIEIKKNSSDELASTAAGVVQLISALLTNRRIEVPKWLKQLSSTQIQSPAVENALAHPPLAKDMHAQAVEAHHPTTPQAPKPQAPAPQQTLVHAQAARQQTQPAQGSAPLPGSAGEEWRKDENFLKALRAAAEDSLKATVFGAQVVKQVQKKNQGIINRLKAVTETPTKTADEEKLRKGAQAIFDAVKKIWLSKRDPADVEKEAAEQIARGVKPARQEFDVAKFVAEFTQLNNGERRLKMCEFNSEWEADPALITRLAGLLAFTEKDGEVKYASSAEIVKSALEFIDAAGGTSEKRTAIGEAALRRIADLAGSMSVHPDITKKSEDLLLKLATGEEMTALLSTENMEPSI